MFHIERSVSDEEERCWILAQHIITPRRSWKEAGLKHTRGLPDMTHNHENPYPGVHRGTDRKTWYFVFTSRGRRHYLSGFTSAESAAQAHDNYVRAHGIDRALIFEERAYDFS